MKNKETKLFNEGADSRFKALHSDISPLLSRCEDYARWTLPYVFPDNITTDKDNTEKAKSQDSTAAAGVNNLANKLTMTMFRPHMPFVRLRADSDVLLELAKQAEQDEEANALLSEIDERLSEAEKKVMQQLDYSHYRTEATETAKRLIITGNAMLYHPESGGRVQSYSLRDYVVKRDLSGNVVEFITRDTKSLETFSKHIQDQIRFSKKYKPSGNKGKKGNDEDVNLYTHLKMDSDGKYHMQQYADNIKLDSEGSWPAEELPWIILTWNLSKGSDYGTGLVEDYAGAIHGLYQLSEAFVSVVGVASDIKWLVDPMSMLDVERLNNAPSGSYHTGRRDDIQAAQLDKQVDLQIVLEQIRDWRQQIGQAFLVFNSVQRDAERVTAEETRYVAESLELAHGGIYSRFADEWQKRTAVLMLKRIDIKVGDGTVIYPQIITGLDSLSRAGDMQNYRMFINDLAIVNNLPEAVQTEINMAKLIAYIGLRHSVDFEKFMKTQGEKQAEQEQMMQMQQQQLAMQAQAQASGQIATEAGKQAVQ